MMDLKENFIQLCLPFSKDESLINHFWHEIETKYSEKSRHYHDLLHLENMFRELDSVKDRIKNFTAVSFAVFYHDIIYNASSKSNEEKSASYAESRLGNLGLPQDLISKITTQIIATKTHQKAEDTDTNYLLDADLSILGKDPEVYLDYTRKIRKEYFIYPDLLYKPGRKKVLKHFLELESVFKTDEFRGKYELKSKKNMAEELKIL
ncbi:HD domain-containing protein [Chryseobacterium carnipullorum]|uniref:Uncharacterized protein conserved in bacteria n=2 Tax=Chryseobacterium carnipullorum TaxID=1124835 RepID=A0A1M7LCH4_CHRCU|nr:hypothetical protein [Chryseobacterium carnipullorum]SHM75806.1 Predicted metal-dependent phosphohydrolase, HD superfamily [Chryseobacterium carnipullorum]STD04435.1 Uncharacterized protein conserved in bacteria [Chryseobacterium carnipullorum]